MSFMAIDVGTTGCKVIAFDINGRPLAEAYREYPIISTSPGWAELDSRVVIGHCKDCISQVALETKSTDPVTAIAVSSQGEAFAVVDEKGDYLCNAMVSFDTRSQKQVADITEKLGLDYIYQTTGQLPHTMGTLFKIAWLRENQPEILEKAKHILCIQDLIGFELTGETAIDYSMAARTVLLDVKNKKWDSRILQAVELDESVLATPMPSGKAFGKVREAICQELNLASGVVVVTGGHDQPCGALGSGVIEPGLASYAIGTVECITPAFDKLLLNDTLRDSNLVTYSHVVDKLFITLAFSLTGGNLLRWFRDQFGSEEIRLAKEKSKDPYEFILQQIPDDPTNVLVLPHFVTTGTPYFDSNPTSAILGMDLTTSRGQFIKALLEGVTYEMRLNTEILSDAGIEINQLRAIGGGAKSDIWMQLKSDIIGIPVVSMNVSEATCLGAAILAAVGCGAISSPQQVIDSWVQPRRTFEPNQKNVAIYSEKYNIYKKMYETIKPLGERLAKLK